MKKSDRIYIAGHQGMVGSALVRCFESHGYANLVYATRKELDLTDHAAAEAFLKSAEPDAVIVAAARVGGIHANSVRPASFIYENLAIATHLIHGAFKAGVPHLLFLGSSCIYPREAPQPIREDALLSGPLEPTNEGYAIAKIAGLKLCELYRRQHGVLFHSAMPTNLYGPGDNYHPEDSHVIPGMILRFHEAKQRGDREVAIWGTGTARREFLHVDDLAEGCIRLLEIDDPPDLVNIGCGEDVTTRDLAEMIAEVVGFEGTIRTDISRPDGTPRKLLDVTLIKSLGWEPRIPLKEGLSRTYEEFLRECRGARL